MTSPKNPHYISQSLQEALDDFLRDTQDRLVSDSTTLDPNSSAIRLSHLRGQKELVDFIYKQLPKELQNGWDFRRGSAGTRPSNTTAGGGEGATRTGRGGQKRRTKGLGPTRGIFSSFNRSRNTGDK